MKKHRLFLLFLAVTFAASGTVHADDPPATPPAPASDPAPADEAGQASFTDAAGLEVEVDPIEYRTGGDDTVMRKIPGVRKHPNVVLKRTPPAEDISWDTFGDGLEVSTPGGSSQSQVSGSDAKFSEAQPMAMQENSHGRA